MYDLKQRLINEKTWVIRVLFFCHIYNSFSYIRIKVGEYVIRDLWGVTFLWGLMKNIGKLWFLNIEILVQNVTMPIQGRIAFHFFLTELRNSIFRFKFFLIRTEYGDLSTKSLKSARIRKNMEQKKGMNWILFLQWNWKPLW